MRNSLTSRPLLALSAGVIILLLLKYFWTAVMFPGVPFGYDAGIYRFLFLREAAGWPPIVTPDLPEWAKSHAPGLFFLTSPLVALGLSPDALIGWIWNLLPVVLIVTLALLVRRKHGGSVGFFVLVCGLLSVVQMQGFLMMYYKVIVAMLLCVLAFERFEARSLLAVPLGMMTIAVHQQIGLIFAVSTFSALVSRFFFSRSTFTLSSVLQWTTTLLLGAAWYLPTYQRSLGDIVPQLLGSGTLILLAVAMIVVGMFAVLIVTLPDKHHRVLWGVCLGIGALMVIALPAVSDAPNFVVHYLFSHSDSAPGAFFSITEYLQMSAPLLFLGLVGLVFSVENNRGTSWQWAALWSGIAVVGMFFFYRRFILPLDFFLLPFAALACAALFQNLRGRVILVALLGIQLFFQVQQLRAADPHVEREWLESFSTLSEVVPSGSTVVVLDTMAPWVLGYLPDAEVSGPGIFNSRSYEEWEKFLLGSEEDRTAFLSFYPRGTFFFASEVFDLYYPPDVKSVLRHSCLTPTSHIGLYQSECGSAEST